MKLFRYCITLSCFLILSFTNAIYAHPIITIIGAGYVGLVSGPGLAEFGNTVICADMDTEKIAALHRGEIPIYEPGLKDLINRNVATGRLSFTSNVAQAIEDADIIIIAVGTPMGEDGSADLRSVERVVSQITPTKEKHKIICTKSTVPVGTGAWIRTLFEARGIAPDTFSVVSNPEFLREGCAIDDFLHADRIVIGTEDEATRQIMCEIYKKPCLEGTQLVLTNLASSELIKYASNGFLAIKISYVNELANLCDAVGADIKTVTRAMGLDPRIGKLFLNPGPGYGGSCLPKDCQALVHIAQDHKVSAQLIQAAITANEHQKEIAYEKLLKLLDNKLEGATIAILGLAFKANTDDIRYSPAITTIKKLLEHKAIVKAYDPEAMANMKRYFFPNISYCSDSYEALTKADAVIIMTEWDEFKKLDWQKIASLMAHKVVVDARNIIDAEVLNTLGFAFETIGRTCLATSK